VPSSGSSPQTPSTVSVPFSLSWFPADPLYIIGQANMQKYTVFCKIKDTKLASMTPLATPTVFDSKIMSTCTCILSSSKIAKKI
jgi:hypothetical protein